MKKFSLKDDTLSESNLETIFILFIPGTLKYLQTKAS